MTRADALAELERLGARVVPEGAVPDGILGEIRAAVREWRGRGAGVLLLGDDGTRVEVRTADLTVAKVRTAVEEMREAMLRAREERLAIGAARGGETVFESIDDAIEGLGRMTADVERMIAEKGGRE